MGRPVRGRKDHAVATATQRTDRSGEGIGMEALVGVVDQQRAFAAKVPAYAAGWRRRKPRGGRFRDPQQIGRPTGLQLPRDPGLAVPGTTGHQQEPAHLRLVCACFAVHAAQDTAIDGPAVFASVCADAGYPELSTWIGGTTNRRRVASQPTRATTRVPAPIPSHQIAGLKRPGRSNSSTAIR